MQELDRLVDMIATLVRGGLAPEDARKNLMILGLDPGLIEQSMTGFYVRTGRIRNLKEPRTLEVKGLSEWYPGPGEADRFWPPLQKLLERRGWEKKAITSLDHASTKVVSLLQPPGLGRFTTRGLVLGYVQSGKTANFSAVIAKTADVNYKFFIILSGITNSLRGQTQRRLESELIGLNREDWVSLTTPDQDFLPGAAGNVDAFLTDHHSHKVLCVVKKNATVLRRLLKWLKGAKPEVIGNCPVLIIDDEADQASVNGTGFAERRTAVNKLLLDLLQALPKAAYVGYTATPFANIFIDPSVPEDLYPRDFIVDLPQPDEYFGAERIFGREPLTHDDPEVEFEGLDMIRRVSEDEVTRLKPRGVNDQAGFEPQLTPSLETAIRYFWLATAARAARGDAEKHSTMLVHTTLYAAVHIRFRPLVEQYRAQVLRQLRSSDAGLISELRTLWDAEQQRVPATTQGEPSTDFSQLAPHLIETLKRTEVIVDNSRSESTLEYGDTGRVIIVIGGNTLARGLTLEGLVVSFFVRTASAYDTLLQMGRWFGYRRGYRDLPRVWMTEELEGYFYDLAAVEQEMRNDIRRYELEDLTPLEFAVRIRTHPSLSITARAKMQAAVACDVSYSGRRLQTILFNHKDRDWVNRNLRAGQALIERVRNRGIVPAGERNIVFKNVPVQEVLTFLDEYQFHENALELKSNLIRSYIKAQNMDGELLQWNVVIIGRETVEGPERLNLGPGLDVPLLNRSRFVAGMATPHANLKAIMSDIDRVADLGLTAADVRGKEPGELQGLRPRGIGLLLLYPIAKDSRPLRDRGSSKTNRREPLDAIDHLLGVGMVFPEASTLTPQQYMTVDLSRIVREEEEIPEEEEEQA